MPGAHPQMRHQVNAQHISQQPKYMAGSRAYPTMDSRANKPDGPAWMAQSSNRGDGAEMIPGIDELRATQ